MDAKEKTERVLQAVSGARGTQAADVRLSLVMAALCSYRHDSVLRPFPPTFVKDDLQADDRNDYTLLKKTMNKLPCLNEINASYLARIQISDPEVLDLLYWALCSPAFDLKPCPKDVFADLKVRAGQVTEVPAPDYILEVVPSDSSEARFTELCAGRERLYAYHGTRLENFHSILHYGLQGHMSKNALFGEGTYLSSELAVSLHYSPQCQGWKQSMLGSILSCIALCEMINDPSHVKCQDTDNDGKKQQARSRVKGSLGGDVPDKYYVVRNNDMVRVSHLLVYTHSKPAPPRARRWSAGEWLRRHKFVLLLLGYLLLLVVISLYNSTSFHSLLRRYWRGPRLRPS